MDRVLLTGGAGFIGGYLVDLLTQAYEIVVLDNLSPQVHGDDPENSPLLRRIHGKCTFIRADVTDAEAVEQALSGVTHVIHLAAETGTGQSMYELRRYTTVNLTGLATLFEAIARSKAPVRQIVLPSSRSVYGEGKYHCTHDGIVHPDSRSVVDMKNGDFTVKCPTCGRAATLYPTDEGSELRPASFYAYTKMSQEDMVRQTCAAMGIDFTIMRYQNVYGVGQSLDNPYTGLLSILSRRFVAGEPVNVYEDGAAGRDFVYVSDVARLTAATLGRPEAYGKTLNVGSGEFHTLLEVAEALKTAYGSTSTITVSGDFRKGDIRGNVADMTLTTATLGIKPEVGFEPGMKKLAEWVITTSPTLKNDNKLERSLTELSDAGILFRGDAS